MYGLFASRDVKEQPWFGHFKLAINFVVEGHKHKVWVLVFLERVEIDHEIISTVILLPPLNHLRRVVVSYKRKYVHEVLVNCLFKLVQEKV